MSSRQVVRTGLECCLEQPPNVLKSARFALLMNQASVNRRLQYSCDLLAAASPGRLHSIFSPQHGLWGEQQANMIESAHGGYPPLDLPVFSLYSKTRRPTPEMLAGIDCLVIDLQDVGTRIYTFIWTMLECLRACAKAGVAVVVLDRPNPLGGEVVEGPLLEQDFTSFVGGWPIPMRHGLTMGELARLFVREAEIDVDLQVVPLTGWRRSMLFPETGLPWTLVSPNMQRFETAVVYPGQVLLEGTNLSEGRGTTLPFEYAGAPFLDPWELARAVQASKPPGVVVRPTRFQPTFDKHSGESCGGIALHVESPCDVRSFELTLTLLAAARQQAPDQFRWLPPPYEYEQERPPIDILFGSSRLREGLAEMDEIDQATIRLLAAVDVEAWNERIGPIRLYP